MVAGDKFMPEMHLIQPRFTYSTCGPFTKNKEQIQTFKETDSIYIYQNEPVKVCFQHGMAYGDVKDLPRRTAFDEILHDKAFNIAENPKYDGYQWGLASVVYKCFDKKTSIKGTGINSGGISKNKELGEELYKPIIKKFEKIWDLADMQLLSKFNKGIVFFTVCYWYL